MGVNKPQKLTLSSQKSQPLSVKSSSEVLDLKNTLFASPDSYL